MSNQLAIAGAGPAGSSAAIAASLAGLQVRLYEKSALPRHKVCGEFLSPEIAGSLEALGLWSRFQQLEPARIERLTLRFPSVERTSRLPEPAFGLSRYRLDQLLFEHALAQGAVAVRTSAAPDARPLVIAHGRRAVAPPGMRGRRLFGFKAHFDGPSNGAIELYFFRGGYVGVSAIEGGRTNVCGLALEDALARAGFEMDDFVGAVAALRARLDPLHRVTQWFSVGPLVFGNRFRDEIHDGVYPAGDALSFVDPFTGSGLSAALFTGWLAGVCAARGIAPRAYVNACEIALARPFAAASLFRRTLGTAWAETAARWLPGALLFRLTRPRHAGRAVLK
jgi:flavin-dependent dehydrogenase